jgi:hypothetical protein
LSQPSEAASPIVIAPPLRRRRKSRRSARVFRTTVSSIFRSLWSARGRRDAKPGPGARC